MTFNFDTLKASLVLYGLDAIYAILLLIVGWYLAGAGQRFVARVLTVTHRVDALVTVFLASLVRYAILVIVGIAVLQLFGIQTASLWLFWAPPHSRSGSHCRARFPTSQPA